MPRRSSPLMAMFLGGLLVLAGCATGGASAPQVTAIAPALPREVGEPARGLLTIDARGEVRQLDLLDETVAELGAVSPSSGASSDGRYVFSDTGRGVQVVDSGRWTWDHRDHFHYYVADPRMLGVVTGTGRATVATTTSSTTGGTGLFFAGSGEAVLLDTGGLSEGELVERFRLTTEPHAGMVVPIGPFALVTRSSAGVAASVALFDDEGMPVPGVTAECSGAQGSVTTRVGAVIGCADGAVLATLVAGEVVLERIPYPAGAAAPRATAFAGREGRPTVAALAGPGQIWLLDTRARAWTLLPVDSPLVQVTAVDDDAAHVLGLAEDGRVMVIDGATGATLARTEPLVERSLEAGIGAPTLIADHSRAYLNGPVERAVYELDFADAARITRVFTTDSGPAVLAVTGR